MQDFRPISLIGSMYKIIAKLLANRLQRVLGQIISPSQSAFVQGRQILDAVLIANELLDSRIRSRQPGVLCKLDLAKAYDHVDWGFLLYMLQRCGFQPRWQRWILFCISTVHFSVLINGSPCGFFSSSRGLRQGDPLSPFLFVLVMEAMSRMLGRVASVGLLSGFSVGGATGVPVEVSHLFFADDSLIMCEASLSQIEVLRSVLIWFEAVSGLRVNMSKSALVPVGEIPSLGELAASLGCEVLQLPISYLGLPLGAPHNSLTVWNPVFEKMERRLAGWRRSYLSKGGRLTLLRSVLSSLPTYFMSLFHIPTSVASRLEKLQRTFLWDSSGETRKYHLVDWQRVCRPLQHGGLAIRQLCRVNEALLGKWLWRFGHERDALWRRVIAGKYGVCAGGWTTPLPRGSYGVSVWRSIRSGWEAFSSFVRFQVRDGQTVSFWEDRWCADSSLRALFPELHSIASAPHAMVAEMLRGQAGSRHWDVRFTRRAQDWELEDFARLFGLLAEALPIVSGMDSMVWIPSPARGFRVRSFYRVLLPWMDAFPPWKALWKAKSPSRIAVFAWLAVLGRILTTDNLRRRGVPVVSRCFLCLAAEETVDHLLLHCEWAWRLWSDMFRLFGVQWVMPQTVFDLFSCWLGGEGRHSAVWRLVPHAIIWTLWRERNSRVFENTEHLIGDLQSSLLRYMLDWLVGAGFSRFSCTTDVVEGCVL